MNEGSQQLALALPVDLPTMLRTLEDQYIDKALQETSGNKKEAAKLLGMRRTTFVEKLRRHRPELLKARHVREP